MCLPRFGTQTSVVMAMAYTVPKRSIPGRSCEIPVPPGSNLSAIVPEQELGSHWNGYSETMDLIP
jgi:hypothetical protein